MKKFNVTGLCVKEKHYMADTSEKINKIIRLIDEGSILLSTGQGSMVKQQPFSLLERLCRTSIHA